MAAGRVSARPRGGAHRELPFVGCPGAIVFSSRTVTCLKGTLLKCVGCANRLIFPASGRPRQGRPTYGAALRGGGARVYPNRRPDHAACAAPLRSMPCAQWRQTYPQAPRPMRRPGTRSCDPVQSPLRRARVCRRHISPPFWLLRKADRRIQCRPRDGGKGFTLPPS